MWLSWHAATLLALALAVAGFCVPERAHWVTVTKAVLKEAALIAALYALWQLAGSLSIMNATRAVARGRWIWHVEQRWHFASELWLQRLVIHQSWFVRGSNLYYAIVHGPALFACLIWLFARHRDHYPKNRNTIAIVTGACLAIQLIPVAPPRMLTDVGFVDTGLRFHQSVYGTVQSGPFDQFSAMPSVHVAWAVLIALAVIGASTSRWRWLVLLHPVATATVVVVTANHFWADGLVAVALIPVAWGLRWLARTTVAALARPLRSYEIPDEQIIPDLISTG